MMTIEWYPIPNFTPKNNDEKFTALFLTLKKKRKSEFRVIIT